MVDGIVWLYYYQDNFIDRYYFIKDINDSLVELKNTQYYRNREYNIFENKNEYIQILAPILQNSTNPAKS